MIIFAVVLAVLGAITLTCAVLWAVDSHREHVELLRIRQVARSAEWRLQRLGQEALAEMLDVALQAAQRQESESGS
jgi:hypothetical protein